MARNFTASTNQVAFTLTNNMSGYSGLTLAGWFNIQGSNPPNGAYEAIIGTDGTMGIFWKPNTTAFAYYLSLTAGESLDPGGQTLAAPTGWHHLALTATAGGGTGSATGYFDGSSDGTFNSPATFASHTAVFLGNDTSSEWVNGYLSDCAIWSVALTQLEIAALAKGHRPYIIRPASLQAYFPLYGLASPEPDLSGKSQNGTLTGTAQITPDAPVTLWTPPPRIQALNPEVPTMYFTMSIPITGQVGITIP